MPAFEFLPSESNLVFITVLGNQSHAFAVVLPYTLWFLQVVHTLLKQRALFTQGPYTFRRVWISARYSLPEGVDKRALFTQGP